MRNRTGVLKLDYAWLVVHHLPTRHQIFILPVTNHTLLIAGGNRRGYRKLLAPGPVFCAAFFEQGRQAPQDVASPVPLRVEVQIRVRLCARP